MPRPSCPKYGIGFRSHGGTSHIKYPFWETLIAPLIEAAEARRIVEIGALRGETPRCCSMPLLPTARSTSSTRSRNSIPASTSGVSRSVCVPPGPEPDRPDRCRAFDVALIDGDHNWYTVYNELRTLGETSVGEGAPLHSWCCTACAGRKADVTCTTHLSRFPPNSFSPSTQSRVASITDVVEGVYALLEWQTALNECEAAFAGADDLGRRVAAVVAPDPDCELPPDTAPRFAESGPRPTGFARSSDLRRWPIGVPSRRALPPPPAARRRSTGGSRPRRRPPSRRALRQGESDLRGVPDASGSAGASSPGRRGTASAASADLQRRLPRQRRAGLRVPRSRRRPSAQPRLLVRRLVSFASGTRPAAAWDEDLHLARQLLERRFLARDARVRCDPARRRLHGHCRLGAAPRVGGFAGERRPGAQSTGLGGARRGRPRLLWVRSSRSSRPPPRSA